MICYRGKKISKINSTLHRAIVSIVPRSSFKARKEAFLHEFSCVSGIVLARRDVR